MQNEEEVEWTAKTTATATITKRKASKSPELVGFKSSYSNLHTHADLERRSLDV